jgi:hypothetical protein
MTSGEISYVTLTYQQDSSEITWIYKVEEDILRSAQMWMAQQSAAPATQDLADWFRKNGAVQDCPSGPAFIRRNAADGSIEERYCRNGLPHRDDGPAYSWRRADGSTYEAYWRMGKLHREDGPAVVERRADGSTKEMYYRDGVNHRLNGPAVVERYADGSWVERYYRNGKRHREGGPATAIRRSDGSTVEEYYREDNLHCEDGPADIRRYADGWTVERYCLDGKLVKTERFPANTLISGVAVTPVLPNVPPPNPAP